MPHEAKVADESIREGVRAELARQWREHPSVIHLPSGRPRYQVTGRSPGGGPPTGPIRRVFNGIGYGIGYLLMLPVLAVWGIVHQILDLVGLGPGNTPIRAKATVTGKRECAALGLADALRDAEGPRWLVWSHSRMAVVQAGGVSGPRVIWAAGAQRPRLKATEVALTWADGSQVTVPISKGERDRVQRSGGRP